MEKIFDLGPIILSQMEQINKDTSKKVSVLDDLIGKKFGKWLVLRNYNNDMHYSARKYFCRCDCGTEAEVYGSALKQNKSLQCVRCRTRKARAAKKFINNPVKAQEVL